MADTAVVTETGVADLKLFPWWILLLWGILALLIGVAFFMTPGVTTALIITFLGAYWFVGGLFTLISLAVDKSNMGWKIFLGVLYIIAGLLILLQPIYAMFFLIPFLVILIGFWAVFIGFAHLFHAFSVKDAGDGVLGIISLIFGLLILVNVFVASVLLPFVVGAFAIIFGLAAIVCAFMAKKCVCAAPA